MSLNCKGIDISSITGNVGRYPEISIPREMKCVTPSIGVILRCVSHVMMAGDTFQQSNSISSPTKATRRWQNFLKGALRNGNQLQNVPITNVHHPDIHFSNWNTWRSSTMEMQWSSIPDFHIIHNEFYFTQTLLNVCNVRCRREPQTPLCHCWRLSVLYEIHDIAVEEVASIPTTIYTWKVSLRHQQPVLEHQHEATVPWTPTWWSVITSKMYKAVIEQRCLILAAFCTALPSFSRCHTTHVNFPDGDRTI